VALTEHTVNLSGKVQHQGLSLAQVQVKLYDLYSCNFDQSGDPFVCLAEAKTGSRGEFSFSVKPGVYRLEVIPDGKTRFLAQTMTEVKVITSTNVNVSLATGCIVKGRVATGFGFEGNRSVLFAACEVVALGIEPTSYKTHSGVAEDGTFSLIIPRGKYYFAVRSTQESDDPPYNEQNPPKFISTECQIFSVSGDSELTLGLPSFVTFSGEVVDIFGTPLASANVLVVPAVSSQNLLIGELNMCARAVTDKDGLFTLSLQEGLYDISIDPSAGSSHFSYKENELSVSAPQGAQNTKIQRKFTLEEGYRLQGVVQLNEQPLSQALVRVQSVERKNEYIARSDEQGRFILSLPGGGYKLIVAAHPKDAHTITIDGHEYSALAPWTHSLLLDADVNLAVSLIDGTALTGRICDDALQARPGVRVQIFADVAQHNSADNDNADENPGEQTPDPASPVLATGITDGEGRYALFLAPGAYWVVIHRDFANAKFVQVDNDPVTLDITWHGWSQLTFEVVGEGGHSVSRCQVFYHPYGQEMDEKPPLASSAMPLPHGYVLTTDEGLCRLTLPAGVYTFKFVPPEAGSFSPKVIRQLSISADITRRVTLDSKQSTAAIGTRDGVSEGS